MATANRRRPILGVTLDPDLVRRARKLGLKMAPKETSLSRLLDRALAEFLDRHSGRLIQAKVNGVPVSDPSILEDHGGQN